MSFDLFLQGFKEGNSFPVDRTSVLEVLHRFTDKKPNKFGFYLLEFEDGSHVELNAKELESADIFDSCAFHLRNFSPMVLHFVYEIAVAGNMVVLNPQSDGSNESPIAIIFSEAQRMHLPESINKNPRLVLSAEDLAKAIGSDVSKWEHYRDQVVSGYSDKQNRVRCSVHGRRS